MPEDSPDKADRVTAESNRWALEHNSFARGERDLIEGKTFTTGKLWEDVAPKANENNDRNFLLRNPPGSGVHLILSIQTTASGGQTFSRFHANPGITTLGTEVFPTNNKIDEGENSIASAYEESDLDYTQGVEFNNKIIGAGDTGFVTDTPAINPFRLIQVPPGNDAVQTTVNQTAKELDITIEMSYAEIETEGV